jgi:DNA polymerase-3 subunit alpha
MNGTPADQETDALEHPDIPELNKQEMLSYEKECLGFYITGHPLDNVMHLLKKYSTMDTLEANTTENETDVTIGGVVRSIKEIKTKKGDIMAFVTLEDLSGFVELTIFTDLYKQSAALLKSEKPVLVRGRLTIENETKRNIVANEIIPLENAAERFNPDIHLKCYISKLNSQEIMKIKNILANNSGKSRVFLHVVIPDTSETVISLGKDYQATPSELFIREMESILGKHSISYN